MHWISIFLMMCSMAYGSSCLVGGSSAHVNNAGWFEESDISIAQTDLGLGDAMAVGDGGAITDAGAGAALLTDTDQFDEAIAGMYIWIDFTDNTHTDGRYLIAGVTGNDAVELDTAHLGDENVTAWRLGGAVPATYNAVAYDLEDVLDDSYGSAASKHVYIYIYLAAAQELTESIMIDSQGGSGKYRKNIIGCDATYAALSNGSYTEYINTNKAPGGFAIYTISVANVTMENMAALDPGGDEQPDSGENGFTSSALEFIARNCRARNGFYGFSSSSQSSALVDCIAYDNRIAQATFASHGCSVIGGYYELNRTEAWVGSYLINFAGISNTCVGATLVGDVLALNYGSYGSHIILNNTFKDQTVQAILINAADGCLLVMNNIFKLADTANDVEVTLTAGSMYSDYNVSNVATATPTTLTGVNDVTNLTAMSDTSPWVNAAKNTDNYKLDRTDGLIGNFLEVGWAPYMFTGITGVNIHKMSIGAYMTYDLPTVANTDSSDTVYGTTGTASGGGRTPGIGSGIGR